MDMFNLPLLFLKQNNRHKRNINCHPGVSECCRENLYISFAEIGWDEWILQPRGYHAYFCHGSCNNAASITQSGAHHSSLIQVSISKYTICVYTLSTFFLFMVYLNKCDGMDCNIFKYSVHSTPLPILPTVIGQLLFFQLSQWQLDDRGVALRIQPQADIYWSVH